MFTKTRTAIEEITIKIIIKLGNKDNPENSRRKILITNIRKLERILVVFDVNQRNRMLLVHLQNCLNLEIWLK